MKRGWRNCAAGCRYQLIAGFNDARKAVQLTKAGPHSTPAFRLVAQGRLSTPVAKPPPPLGMTGTRRMTGIRRVQSAFELRLPKSVWCAKAIILGTNSR